MTENIWRPIAGHKTKCGRPKWCCWNGVRLHVDALGRRWICNRWERAEKKCAELNARATP
jgi:hypothetical protein